MIARVISTKVDLVGFESFSSTANTPKASYLSDVRSILDSTVWYSLFRALSSIIATKLIILIASLYLSVFSKKIDKLE